MRIASLRISNFRCFRNRDEEQWAFQFTPQLGLNLLVGPNGAGKTAVVRAIDLVLNLANRYERHLISELDFPDCDTSRLIIIEAVLSDLRESVSAFASYIQWFDPSDWQPIENKPEASVDSQKHVRGVGIRFEAWFDASYGEFRWKWVFPKFRAAELQEQDELTRQHHYAINLCRINPVTSSGALSLGEHSLLGRCLRRESYKLGLLSFKPSLGDCSLDCTECGNKDSCVPPVERNGSMVTLGGYLTSIADRAKAYLGVTDGHQAAIGERYGGITSRLSGTTLGFRTSSGIQSSFIPCDCFSSGEKYAFAFALATQSAQNAESPIIIVEEPETALYPPAIGRVLADVRGNNSPQIIVTSHSEAVLRLFSPSDVFVLGRDRSARNLAGTMDTTGVSKNVLDDFCYILIPGHASALLSDKILLVEGEGDAIASGELDRLASVNCPSLGFLSSKGWLPLQCKGVDKVTAYAQVLLALGYRVCALLDGDEAGNRNAEQVSKYIPTFVYSSSTVDSPCLEEALWLGLPADKRATALVLLRDNEQCKACPYYRLRETPCWNACDRISKQQVKERTRRACLEVFGTANTFPYAFMLLAQQIEDAEDAQLIRLAADRPEGDI